MAALVMMITGRCRRLLARMMYSYCMLLCCVLWLLLSLRLVSVGGTSRPGPYKTLVRQVPGPFWKGDAMCRANVTGGLEYGVPLELRMQLVDGSDAALVGARVDIWQCSYRGVYSDSAQESTVGLKWLRGYQITDPQGQVTFYTIYPGWYEIRTVHIHIRVRTYAKKPLFGYGYIIDYDDTTQIYFDDGVSDDIFANVYPYTLRGETRPMNNSNDLLFNATNLVNLIGHYSHPGGYKAHVVISLPFSSNLPHN